MIKRLKISIPLLAFVCLIVPFAAVGQRVAEDVNPAFWHEMPNGFRYVLKNNTRPANQISFRLVMAVGSLQERTGEEGAAHFVEHLAFRDTKRFPNGSVVRHLEALGGKYGITINAYTGYDRTVYMFTVPSGDSRMLDLGIKIVADWLSGIVFTHQSVEAEKPIIYEEIREGADADCLDKLKKGADSRLHRLPVGSVEQVRKITPELLTQFYRRNYTAHNATLIISGPDVETNETKRLIETAFAGVAGKPVLREKPQPLPYDERYNFVPCQDKYREKAALEWMAPMRSKTVLTQNQLIDDETDRLIVSLLNKRLRDKKNRGRISKQWYLGATEHLCFELEAESDSLLLEDFGKGVAILEGVARKGFSEEELMQQKAEFVAGYGKANFLKTSEQWNDYYTSIVLAGWRDAISEKENSAIAAAIGQLTLNQCNAATADLLKNISGNPLIGYRFNPQLHQPLNVGTVTKRFDEARLHPDTSNVPPAAMQNETCLPDTSFLRLNFKHSPHSTVREQQYEQLGAHEIWLKNGARVIFKPGSNADSTVSVVMLFKGGLSAIPKEKYPLLESVASYMSMGGIEGVSTDVYNETLAENALGAINTIEPNWHGIMASGKTSNIPLLASLVYARCFKPEKCFALFEEIKAEMKSERITRKSQSAVQKSVSTSPERLMRKKIHQLVEGVSSCSAEELSEQEIESLNLDTIAAFYRQIYTRSTGLTCIVTGNFDIGEAKEHFIGMLSQFQPSPIAAYPCPSAEAESRGLWCKVADSEQSGRLTFSYLHRGKYEGGLRQTLVLKIMRDLLRHRIIEEIRNNAGLIYSPYIDLYYKSVPDTTFAFDINGAINQENAFVVKEKIDSIIEQMQTCLPDVKTFEAIKKSFLITRDEYLSPDASANWKEYLTSCVKENNPLADAERYEDILDSITPEDVRNMFRDVVPRLRRTFLYVGNELTINSTPILINPPRNNETSMLISYTQEYK